MHPTIWSVHSILHFLSISLSPFSSYQLALEETKRDLEKRVIGLEGDLKREASDMDMLKRQLADVQSGKGSVEDRAANVERECSRLKEEVSTLRRDKDDLELTNSSLDRWHRFTLEHHSNTPFN